MWLKLVLFLLYAKVSLTFDLPRKCLSDLKINNHSYNVSEVYHVGESNTYPTDAHYDMFGNLFFVKTTENDQGYHYDIYVVKFKSVVPQKVPGLPEGISYSVAIDKNLAKVYFGTGKGMFVYNYESHTAVAILNKQNIKVDNIFIDIHSNKYIIENVNGVDQLYLLDGDNKIRFHTLEALNEMAIDEKNNFYYIKEDKLYVLKATHSLPQVIGDVNYDGVAQISFNDDNVFVANKNNLKYFNENETGNFKVVNNIPGNVTAIAFDETGNFALGTKGKILRYKKNDCYLRKNNRVVDEYANV